MQDGLTKIEDVGSTALKEERRVMTKNEYSAFIEVEVGKTWERVFAISNGIGKSITKVQEREIQSIWDEFYTITRSIDVKEFNLGKYKLTEGICKLLNRLCDTDCLKDGYYKLTGRCELDNIYSLKDRLNCEGGIHLGYNGYFYNDTVKLILEFCEGDIYVLLFTNKANYTRVKTKTNKYYENY